MYMGVDCITYTNLYDLNTEMICLLVKEGLVEILLNIIVSLQSKEKIMPFIKFNLTTPS